jgi:hypothetical protein
MVEPGESRAVIVTEVGTHQAIFFDADFLRFLAPWLPRQFKEQLP